MKKQKQVPEKRSNTRGLTVSDVASSESTPKIKTWTRCDIGNYKDIDRQRLFADTLKDEFISKEDHEKEISRLIAEDSEWFEKTLPNYIKKEDLKKVLDEFDFEDASGNIIPDEECNWHLRDSHWYPDIKEELKRRLKL